MTGKDQRQKFELLSLSLFLFLAFCLTAGSEILGGKCPVFIYTPFTVANYSAGDYRYNTGFLHLAAAIMAMEHFNERNATVVPELRSLTENCSIRFDLNESLFFDTGTFYHLASRSFLETLLEQRVAPCGLAGAYNDMPALELSVMAQAAQIPFVVNRARNVRVISNYYSPFTSQIYPDVYNLAQQTIAFLLDKNRTSYIALLYALADTGIQRREALTFAFDENNMTWTASTYITDGQPDVDPSDSRGQRAAVERIKQSGYRTIVVAMESTYAEIQAIADAAEEFGLNNGNYFWVWFDVFDEPVIYSENKNITKLLYGSAWILPLAGSLVEPETDPFAIAWKTQGKDEVDHLNAANPIKPGSPGYVVAPESFFQEVQIEFGAPYMYDAVMTLGLGACQAQRNESAVSSIDHLEGVRRSVFHGASGRVELGPVENFGFVATDTAGARLASTVTWGALNFFPPQPPFYNLSHISSPDTGNAWLKLDDFVYQDGRTVPPSLLRDLPDQNYLSRGLRIFGLTLMAVALLASTVSAVWVFIRREHRILKASQPIFLYVLCFGAMVEASTIWTISNDESYGWTEKQLSRSCMATPWLLSLGHMITYSALFCKLWRVHQVLQFSRRKIEARQVIWPTTFLLLCALVLLAVWTAVDPLQWERSEINEVTGESIGKCDNEHFAAFIVPLAFLMLIPTILTAYMAWQTRDVDEMYSESWWIFVLVVVRLEVILVSVPTVALLRDVSTNGRYVGYAIMLWLFPMSTISMIIVPKYIAYKRELRGISNVGQRKRGTRERVQVTGVQPDGTSSDTPTPGYSSSIPGPSCPSQNETQDGQASGKTNLEVRTS